MNTRRLSDDDLTVGRDVIAAAAKDADFIVLPERIREFRERPIAPFRREVQPLLTFARSEGFRIELAVPSDVETAEYEEHAAEWVLPVIFFVAGVPVGVACNLVANWIWSVFGPTTDPRDTVYVRLVREADDGSIELLETRGGVENVVRVLREHRSESAEAD
jgi:hypothetical protein